MRGLLFAKTPGLGGKVHNTVATKDPTALLPQLADETRRSGNISYAHTVETATGSFTGAGASIRGVISD